MVWSSTKASIEKRRRQPATKTCVPYIEISGGPIAHTHSDWTQSLHKQRRCPYLPSEPILPTDSIWSAVVVTGRIGVLAYRALGNVQGVRIIALHSTYIRRASW